MVKCRDVCRQIKRKKEILMPQPLLDQLPSVAANLFERYMNLFNSFPLTSQTSPRFLFWFTYRNLKGLLCPGRDRHAATAKETEYCLSCLRNSLATLIMLMSYVIRK